MPLLGTVVAAALAWGGGGGTSDSLSGVVTDRAGHPIAGAVVVVSELHRVALTGPDGRFVVPDVPAGRYFVIARRIGYSPAAHQVTTGATALKIALEPATLFVEPVTVTATREPAAELASPLPGAALSEEGLRREGTVSLAHALEALPGIRTLSTGGQIGKPVIRGLAGARVLVLDDGSRLEDYSWSDEDGPSVDARLAQRIEVIRGPASVLYGSDAIGGVVNVIPEELPDASGGEGGASRLRSTLDVYGATNNAEVGVAGRLDGASGPWAWRAAAIGRLAGNLHTPAGELDNTGFSALNGAATLGLRSVRGSTTLRYTRYGGEFKLLEAEGPPAGTPEEAGPERKLSDDRVQLAGDYVIGGLRLETKAQWQRHSLIEVSDTGTSAGGAPLEGTAFDLLLNTATLDVLAHRVAGTRLRGTLGLSGLYQTNDSRGPIPLVPDARIRAAAAFAFAQATPGRWSLLAGARVDRRRLTADSNATLALSSQARDYTAVSGDAGVVYRPVPALSVAANVGRAWRAPTLFELFANGAHPGEARYEIGRPDLVPEVGTNVDVSVRWQGRRFHAEVAGYRNAIARYVFITPTNEFRDSLRVYRYEQADALLTGAEAAVDAEIRAPVALRARFDAVRGTNRATGEPLPLVPPARAALGAELRMASLRWADRASIAAEVELVTRQTRLNPLDVATAGYALLNVEAGIDRPLFGRAARIDVSVRNATNVAYRSFLSRYKEFALDPGRSVIVRVSVGE